MPRRSPVSLEDVADRENLARAFARAARAKRLRREVRDWTESWEERIRTLAQDIRSGAATTGAFATFVVHDPKRRVIHAPCFRDRVLHHAMMGVMAPQIDRKMVADTFACRPGRGNLRAAQRAQQHIRQFPWYVKLDVRAYFASIAHDLVLEKLARCFKNHGLLQLCERVVRGFETEPGRGLPIGALTSQHFANLYLTPLDRFLLKQRRVCGMVRYMDDLCWWCPSRSAARSDLRAVEGFLASRLGLAAHRTQIQRSGLGLSFLGFRILRSELRLSSRRKRRYRKARVRWEGLYAQGWISSGLLQAGYASAHAIVAHADSAAWRRAELERFPPLDV